MRISSPGWLPTLSSEARMACSRAPYAAMATSRAMATTTAVATTTRSKREKPFGTAIAHTSHNATR